ncbi:MAG TPA: hypothetical protein VI298_18065, partial [Geobacteraceae bacterium]
ICAAECPRKLTLRAKMSPEARANIGSAKPLFGGSNPLAASTKTKGVSHAWLTPFVFVRGTEKKIAFTPHRSPTNRHRFSLTTL